MNVWTCKIAGDVELPDGADAPMRQAVQRAFYELTGQEAEVCFSGWGGELSEVEQAIVDGAYL